MIFRLLACVFLVCCHQLWGATKSPIVLISVDGLRPDAILKSDARTIQKLKDTGTYFVNATTVRPSITLPSHTSMLTGLDPRQHGVWWNDYLPNLGVVKYPTAFELARNRGFSTAAFVTKDKFKHLNRPGSLLHFEVTQKSGKAVAKAFANYVLAQGIPQVTWIHLPDPDHVGHKLGWMSPFYLEAVEAADEAIGQIVAVATQVSPANPPLFIVTADHGGQGLSHSLDIDANNYIPMIVNGPGIESGIIKNTRVVIYDVAPTILALLDIELPQSFMGRPLPLSILSASVKDKIGQDLLAAYSSANPKNSCFNPIDLAVSKFTASALRWGL
jgi:predicted AlkP superfamily pyrophosphatase or phosphodiesterase